ncbi:MAG: RHS repeat-associated core domain-containing protein [Candidatus Saliniplasma sp.]
MNSDEEVVNQYRYTPFGSPRLKVESVYNPYQYTGRRLDEESCQYYHRARMYSPTENEFISSDFSGFLWTPSRSHGIRRGTEHVHLRRERSGESQGSKRVYVCFLELELFCQISDITKFLKVDRLHKTKT